MTYQWHVFLASLDPTQGSEQAGRRPVLVISRERINQLLPVVNVLPLTSHKGRRIYPNEVLLPAQTAGLRADSVVLCYQLRTLDKARLGTNFGEITDAKLRQAIFRRRTLSTRGVKDCQSLVALTVNDKASSSWSIQNKPHKLRQPRKAVPAFRVRADAVRPLYV